MPFRVGDSPRYGKAEAIASKSLAEAFGFQSVRDFRMQIEKERSDGAVILSGSFVAGIICPIIRRNGCGLLGHRRLMPSRLRSRRTEPRMLPQGKNE